MSADFTPEKEDYKILTPFKMQVLTNFPYIEADFDALTNYQLLCKVVEYLNGVIHNENEVTEQVNSLYNAYVSLQNYVNTYFDNLDLQEEVNNKLDEMVRDGTLANLLNKGYIYASAYPLTTKSEIENLFAQIQLTNRTLFIDCDINLLGENYTIPNLYLKGDNYHKIYNGGLIEVQNVNIENCVFKNMLNEIKISGTLCIVNDSLFKDFKYGVFNGTENTDNSMYFSINNNKFINIALENDTNKNINVISIANGYGNITNNEIDNVGNDQQISTTRVIYLGHAATYTREEITQNPSRLKSTEVINSIIDNNTIKNINNGDGVDLTDGSLDEVAPTNAICVRCDNSVISNNIIENINGFGQDREAIYTKSNNTQIINNTIINGGTGEGAICCKPYAKPDYDNLENETGLIYYDNYNIISGNTIKGYCPVGIKIWSYGLISNNIINTDGSSYIQARMITGDHYENNSNNILKISNNSIRVEKITSYSKSYTLNDQTTVTYTDNDTSNHGNYSMRYENYKNNDELIFTNNKIYIKNMPNCFNKLTGENPQNQRINIKNNSFTLDNEQQENAILLYSQGSIYSNSSKYNDYKINISNNTFNCNVRRLIRYEYYINADNSKINVENNDSDIYETMVYTQQFTPTENTSNQMNNEILIAKNSIRTIGTTGGYLLQHGGNELINIINNNIINLNSYKGFISIQSDNQRGINIINNTLFNNINNSGNIVVSSGTHTISRLHIFFNNLYVIDNAFNSNLRCVICRMVKNIIYNQVTSDGTDNGAGSISTFSNQDNYWNIHSVV